MLDRILDQKQKQKQSKKTLSLAFAQFLTFIITFHFGREVSALGSVENNLEMFK